ncbi:MAG: hypothetical protein ACXWXR_03855 [Candidatus Limnocylindrales bacterium]
MPSAAHLRAHVVDDRSIELLSVDLDRPTVELPPLAELGGVLLGSLVPAVPVLALVGWQPAVVTAGLCLLIRSLSRRVDRSSSVFADGFLRFRGDAAQAQGIQEDDDVRWHWRGGALTGGQEDGTRPSWPGSINL